MHDIDSQINKLTRTSNYMDQLQVITGDIFTIDKEFLEQQLKKVEVLEKMIIPTLEQYFEGKSELIEKYLEISTKFNVVENTLQTVLKKPGKNSKKKPREVKVINHDCVGEKLIKSPWFELIKEMEQKSNDLLESFDTSSFEAVKAVYDSDPNLLEIKTFYKVPIHSPKQLSSLKNLHKILNEIIDLYTKPMYNIRKKIEANWFRLKNVFRDPETNPEIVTMLEQFIICKYRCAITGNNKYYMKLFSDLFDGTEETQAIEGSKFLRILDSIDENQLKDNSNIIAFSKSVKMAIEAMESKEKPLEEILEDIKNTLSKSQEMKEPIEEVDDPLGDVLEDQK